MKTHARLLLLVPLIALALGTLSQSDARQQTIDKKSAESALKRTDKVVFVAGQLSEEQLLIFSTMLPASGHPGVLLFDSRAESPWLKVFLAQFKPDQVIAVGSFPDGVSELERRLNVKTALQFDWQRGQPTELWKTLFPQAERVVIAPSRPRALLLQASCLAGALQAPLIVLQGGEGEVAELQQQCKTWGSKELFLIGEASQLAGKLGEQRETALADEAAVRNAYVERQRKQGPIQTLVVSNPGDLAENKGSLSTIAPWIALQRRAALLLTNEAGDNVAEVVQAAVKKPSLREAENLILVANLRAIPMEHRPNPAAGKDMQIEMEPLTPEEEQPFTFATGRLFHADRSVIPLMLGRPRLLPTDRTQFKALLASNPGGGLPMLEVFSRNTAKEMRNSGFQTTAYFGDDVTKEDIRRLLPDQHLFLWEGHYKTLMDTFEFNSWNEPLQPSLVFLQSCLALNEEESQPILRRGALGVIGSATRNYSASGGAFSLAFFDAMLYDQQTLGSSLRHAKNFLLCYTLLKEKRLGENALLSGANLRSAWAFSLWGDPTLQFVRPTPPADALASIHHELKGNTLIVTLPDTAYEKVTSGRYLATMRPNARLAGLLHKDEDVSTLVPFVFVEVRLPQVPLDKTPTLWSTLPEKQYVFCWDAHRRCGYLLVTPREKDRKELRFLVEWEK